MGNVETSDPVFYKFLCDSGYDHITQTPNHTWIGIKRLLFHYSLHMGVIGDTTGYDDRWCYDTHERAVKAIEEWKSRDFEGGPIYWHRHPTTGRRREPGDVDDRNETINF
mgnify:CR=1 FL=1|tara:strand:+ start:292 stop:621 length:330 start_codon:yes stop_codon:yes gene_type:complete